ncbi:hypothetical protein MPL3356_410020 [Mesorhizobium plurifarium]|uniref:Uncharacterized protein n=1 Tax=Mesorhizobium plurifarium TaxID=69974 RepID=A0A090G0V5_MESPL|nr:hypothetical protein MPL3356_410020 [Mesorhizobium plurifarium]
MIATGASASGFRVIAISDRALSVRRQMFRYRHYRPANIQLIVERRPVSHPLWIAGILRIFQGRAHAVQRLHYRHRLHPGSPWL